MRRDGEQIGAPRDATGSLHSLPPNKAREGQAREKMMPNCQQSQHLKSLPSPLNKDTFLTCFSLFCVLGFVVLLFFWVFLQQHNIFPSTFLQKNESIRITAPKDIKLFSIYGKSFRSSPKVGKSCMIWNYNAVEP